MTTRHRPNELAVGSLAQDPRASLESGPEAPGALGGAPTKVLVAHSYFLRHDPKQWRKMRPYPPLATLIAANELRRLGLEVALFDAMLERGTNAFFGALDTHRPAIVAIVEDNFNFLTKMCTERMREASRAMIAAAHVAGARVAVNGSDATDHPEEYLAAGADAVIVGHVEATLGRVVTQWSAGRHDLDEIPGLILASAGGGLHRTGPQPPLVSIDHLARPAWDLVDVARYRDAWRARHGRFSWNLVASRGCPYRCNWCAKPLFQSRYLQHAPARVAEDMRELKSLVAPDHVWFADDIFGLTAAWVAAFADEVVRRDAQIPFMMQSRANLMMKRDVVRHLRAAGAEEVWMGVESGAQHILNAMDKGTTIQQVRDATRTLRAAGIRVGWFLQLGYLGETWPDILATRDLVRDERPDAIGVSVSYPLPGTKFHAKVRDQLGARRHWRDSDDLAMLFHGTYGTGFYRQVRDLLHAEVDGAPAVSPDTLAAKWAVLAERAARHDAQAEAG